MADKTLMTCWRLTILRFSLRPSRNMRGMAQNQNNKAMPGRGVRGGGGEGGERMSERVHVGRRGKRVHCT